MPAASCSAALVKMLRNSWPAESLNCITECSSLRDVRGLSGARVLIAGNALHDEPD
jgi:hypothetical protein